MSLSADLADYANRFTEQNYLAIQRLQTVFEKVDYIDHESQINSLIGMDDDLSQVEDILLTYRYHGLSIIKEAGIDYNDHMGNIYEISIIVDSLRTIFSPENQDLFQHIKDTSEDGQNFLCRMLEEVTTINRYDWMQLINDFSLDDIKLLDIASAESEADIDEWELARERRDDVVNFMNFLGRENCRIAIGIMSGLDHTIAFSFDLERVLRPMISRYDDFLHNRNLMLLAKDLILLVYASKPMTAFPGDSLSDLLVDLDFEINEARSVISEMLTIFNKWKKSNEQV